MNVEIPKVDGHCTFPVFESGPSMRGSFEKVIGEARKSLGPIPAKDSGLNWGVRFHCRCGAHTCFAPKKSNYGGNFRPVMTWGASMSVLETVIFALILVWAPGLMLSAYLTFGPRRLID